MPLPRANPAGRPDPLPSPYEGDEIELDGSGI
jgi:hypothetical protein